jgi:hypothetical protein
LTNLTQGFCCKYIFLWFVVSFTGRIKNFKITGKRNTQKIERKHLTFRTGLKRLARKTICYSKIMEMHIVMVSLLINFLEFNIDINHIGARPYFKTEEELLLKAGFKSVSIVKQWENTVIFLCNK